MEVNLIGEALKFMVLGMGVVYLFLIVMILALQVQAKLIGKYFKQEDKKTVPSNEWQPKPTDNRNVVAAITAAIIHHNQETNQKGN